MSRWLRAIGRQVYDPWVPTHRAGMTKHAQLLMTLCIIMGWRLFFYANERNEPIHVHCQKGDAECKYWLDRVNFNIEEAFDFNLSPQNRREIKQIIYEHFEYIEQQWDEFQRRKKQ